MQEKSPYHYHYPRLDQFLTHDYDPIEVADKLRETRLALAELMAKEEFGSEWKIVCYRLLYDLEEIFRKLEKAALCGYFGDTMPPVSVIPCHFQRAS